MRKLDVEMKRTDELLYQMIPKSVADRLRRGESAMSTCQVTSIANFHYPCTKQMKSKIKLI